MIAKINKGREIMTVDVAKIGEITVLRSLYYRYDIEIIVTPIGIFAKVTEKLSKITAVLA